MVYWEACVLSYKVRYLIILIRSCSPEVNRSREIKSTRFIAAISGRKKIKAGIIFTPLYWEYSELQFDTLIQKIGSEKAEKFMIVNTEKVSCVLIFGNLHRKNTPCRSRKNGQFKWWISPHEWPLDLRWAALDSYDSAFCSWENKLSNKL